MLSYLALVTICPPSTIEQITIFIFFLFPSLSGSIESSKGFKKEDFENALVNDENIIESVDEQGHKRYMLKDGSYPVVLHRVRSFFSTKSNEVRLNKSILKPEFVNLLLPDLALAPLATEN